MIRVELGFRISVVLAVFFAAALRPRPLAAEDTHGHLQVEVNVAAADLLQAQPAANWVTYNGDYSGRRYSSLTQVNPENVDRLQVEWVFHSRNSDRLEVTPIVVNGLMIVTSANDTFALDAKTGRVVWRNERPISEGLIDDASRHLSRGVAVWHDRVFRETDNAHLLCLDIRSGNLLWDVAYADWNRNYGATSAPLVVKDKVIVGTSGGDDGVRGFIAAYGAESGKLAWRFWTIPAPGEFGSSSWPGKSYLHGGGTTWMPGTYDPELNTIFWGTSNPSPDFEGSVRPGDDLYTNCLLALDPDTGKLKWFFQFTPHDLFDLDATETPVIVDLRYNGQLRKLIIEANRNGYVYTLDRATGEFLSAVRFAEKLNWAKGIDNKGRPIRSGLKPTPEGTRICPGFAGATNWYSPSFNPATGFLYFMTLEYCQNFFSAATPQEFEEGKEFYSTGVKHISGEEPAKKILVAYDVQSGTIAWKNPQIGSGHSSGGTMTTGAGLVFFGDDAQSFEAVDARSGKALWHFNTGQGISASPMSYAVEGRQFVAIAAGSDIFSFALPQ
jgi:alcohol dehydrogenase (cytochrome c)